LTSVRDVPANKFIEHVAKDLKENQKVIIPEFTKFVKTGPNRERAPQNDDWWYIRMASIFRKIYVTGKVNVKSLRSYYGGKKNRGVKPEKFYKAGGKIIRVCLQDLEKLGFVKIADDGGRILTKQGQSYLDKQATQIFKESKKNIKEILKEKKIVEKETKKEIKEEKSLETKEIPKETKKEIKEEKSLEKEEK
jgi:small subunit ribosomal protein S19e